MSSSVQTVSTFQPSARVRLDRVVEQSATVAAAMIFGIDVERDDLGDAFRLILIAARRRHRVVAGDLAVGLRDAN